MHPKLDDETVPSTDVVIEVIALLQSMLLVGLLELGCNIPIRMRSLVRDSGSGAQVIDTRNITFLLYYLEGRVIMMTREERDEHARLVKDLCKAAVDISRHALSMRNGMEDLDHGKLQSVAFFNDPMTDLNVQTTTIVESVWYFMYMKDLGCERDVLGFSTLDEPLLPMLLDSLSDAGVCRYLVAKLSFQHTAIYAWLLAWASALDTAQLEDHSACNPELCTLDKVDLQGPQHAVWCSKICNNVRPPFVEILTALRDGKQPLVQLVHNKATNSLTITVTSVGDLSRPRYRAFSHVWRLVLPNVTAVLEHLN